MRIYLKSLTVIDVLYHTAIKPVETLKENYSRYTCSQFIIETTILSLSKSKRERKSSSSLTVNQLSYLGPIQTGLIQIMNNSYKKSVGSNL
jgi:hypothetical protein